MTRVLTVDEADWNSHLAKFWVNYEYIHFPCPNYGENNNSELAPHVVYWPSTKLSIKRCTSVNKQKNSGSRWTLHNNITRCTDGSSQWETRCRSESQRQMEGLEPSVTHGWPTPAKMRKECCYGQKNLVQYSSLCPSPTHLSHIIKITLSRIKCERYIFMKKCVRSSLKSSLLWLCFRIYLYICICIFVYVYV